jgi:DNA-binding TFAR19-related protein (PDSD5 family)
MDELDGLRQNRIARLQQKQEEEQQLAKQIQQLEDMVRPAMSKDALVRFGNLKAGHPEKAIKALVAMAQLVGKGRSIDDALLREILVRLEPPQREIKIRRV